MASDPVSKTTATWVPCTDPECSDADGMRHKHLVEAQSQTTTIEFHVGDVVRQEFDDGSMGTATIIAIAMDQAWCFYASAECHRVQQIKRLELLDRSKSNV